MELTETQRRYWRKNLNITSILLAIWFVVMAWICAVENSWNCAVVIATMLGNQVLAELLSDLVTRSSLIALMYQSSHSAEHSFDEHVAIVDALARRDAKAAVRLMEDHLHNVERNLQLDPRVPDLAAALMPRN